MPTLARRHFAHRVDVGATNWLDVGPTLQYLISDGFPTNIQRSNTVHWSVRRLTRRRPDGMFDRWADVRSV